MSSSLDLSGLIAKLEQTETWPCEFIFKFIIPATEASEARRRFNSFELIERESSGGKYVSITLTMQAQNSRDVADLYEKAGTLPGVILL